jgi:hypothetical protein
MRCPGCKGENTAKRYFCHKCEAWSSGKDDKLADKHGFTSELPKCPSCGVVLMEALKDARRDSRRRRARAYARHRAEEARKEKEESNSVVERAMRNGSGESPIPVCRLSFRFFCYTKLSVSFRGLYGFRAVRVPRRERE